MAGEVTKTTIRTNVDSRIKTTARLVRSHLIEARDYHAYTTAELEVGDVLLTGIKMPSNAIMSEILVYNDDLDSNATPLLTTDIGLYAVSKFTSTTSSTATVHAADSVLDADLFVDGDTTLQAATTKFTSLAFDSVTMGPDDAHKPLWSLLGYDFDPGTEFGIVVTQATAAATAAAGDVVLLVRYSVDS